jgi:hypothetical protein
MSGGATIYERMEAEARQAGAPKAPLRQVFIEAALIIASVFLLACILYAAQFSGRLRWILGFGLIAVLSVYAWRLVARRTSEPAPLAPPVPRGVVHAGELTSFSAVVRRANHGLPYSQYAVSSRARDVLAERTRLARGLSPEGMRSLVQDPQDLRIVLHDGVLEDFLYLRSPDTEERYRWVWESRAGEGFELALERVLERMEAWR